MGIATIERGYSTEYQYKTTNTRNTALNMVEKTQRFDDNNKDLSEYIDHFDLNWKTEGLPQDWYNLKKRVGFSMDTQMQLLQGVDKQSVALWAEQTKRDALAFCLEYLSDGIVYPFQYEKEYKGDGVWELVDKKYGKTMLETVTKQERNSAVFRSLSRIQDFFLSPHTPDGSMAIMPSPKGPSGLTTDDSKPIVYPDSYWFVMVKDGEQVRGCTIKTDFDLEECREAVGLLNGYPVLSKTSSLEEYNQAVTFLDPRYQDNCSTQHVLQTLQQARTNNPFAFGNKTWKEVARDIQRGEELYRFNKKTQELIEEFKEYVISGDFSEFELRKALAATMLRLSKLFLIDEKQAGHKAYGCYDEERKPMFHITYGQILDKVEEIPGCAGGGINNSKSTLIDSLVPRIGKLGEAAKAEDDPNLCRCNNQSPHFHCPGKRKIKRKIQKRVEYKENKEKKNSEPKYEESEEPCLTVITVGKNITSCPTCGEGKKC